MQPGISRATLAVLALSAAFSPLAIALTAPAEASPAAAFIAPQRPLVLTRTLWRSLKDDQQIVVRRSYLIAFNPAEGGFVVTGTQLTSEVEAPPAVETIARLERSRVDSSSFPLRLDSAGMIRFAVLSSSGVPRLDGENAARALIAGASLPEAERKAADAYLARLAAQGGTVPWPQDLFNPSKPRSVVQRDVALPDGSIGTVTITLSADSQRVAGLPKRVSREVVSEHGGTRRVSREEWSLAELSGP